MIRHLWQSHTTTYIRSHPEAFYKTVFSKVSQNSQKNSCAKVSFSCNFNKNETLDIVVSYEFCEIALTSKYRRQMCANISEESVYMLCVYVNQIINKNLFTTNAAVVFWCDWRSKILLLRSYLQEIWLSYLNHSSCVSGSTVDICFGSRISSIMSVPDPPFSILVLGSKDHVK